MTPSHRRKPRTTTLLLGTGQRVRTEKPHFGAQRASGAPRGPKTTTETAGRSQGRQTLVLENFPDPKLARALSPNGRVHWRSRNSARVEVSSQVVVEATVSRLRPVAGPVRLRLCYVYPVWRKRDIDNLTSGVTKVVIDALVRGRWIPADDSQHVVAVTATAAVERGRRALVIEINEEQP